jgi:hypothetical protein
MGTNRDEDTPSGAALDVAEDVGSDVGTDVEEVTPLPTVHEPRRESRSTRLARIAQLAKRAREGLRVARARGEELAVVSREAVRARPRRAASIFLGVALASAVAPAALRSHGAPGTAASSSASTSVAAAPKPSVLDPKPFQPPSALSGLDLRSIAIDDNGAVASAANGRVARLTLDPKLQLFVSRILAKHKIL